MKIKPDQNAVTMIQELSDAKAPSGFEDEAVAVAKKYGAEFAEITGENINTIKTRLYKALEVLRINIEEA